MANPYVFIVGCPRSGTTLFRHIVDAHPQITITPEAHWIPRWYEERKGVTPEGFVTPALIPHLLEHSKFAHFHISREDLLTLTRTGEPLSYASFVTGIFDLFGRAQQKALVGNKTPDASRTIGTLHALWPDARFVHLIRDGRDVALSFMDWPRVQHKKPGTFPTWREHPIETAALWWELNVRCGRRASEWLEPDLYYELRYESLIANPAAECVALCDFLRLSYDDVMLRFHEGRTGSPADRAAKPDWRPITPGLRDWRAHMSAEDVERFEAVAGELLSELGYPRAVARPQPAMLERASQIRSLLAPDLRRLALPKVPVQPTQ